MTSTDLSEQRILPIAQLDPSVDAQGTTVRGVTTLLWPYSASKKTLALLLVEPDVRLRREQGQVRIQFEGPSAIAIAKSDIGIGDTLHLGLLGAKWCKTRNTVDTLNKNVEWELNYHDRLILRVSAKPLIGS